MQILKVLCLAFGLVLFSDASKAQKLDVTFEHSGKDPVGERLAYHLRNGLRGSHAVNLVDSSKLRLGIYLVTITRDQRESGTAYSITWTIGGMEDDMYISSSVGVCGADVVQSCAEGLVADTDKRVTKILSYRRKQ